MRGLFEFFYLITKRKWLTTDLDIKFVNLYLYRLKAIQYSSHKTFLIKLTTF